MHTFTYLSFALVLAVIGLMSTDNFALQTILAPFATVDSLIKVWTLTNIILPECSSAAWGERIAYGPGRVRLKLKILKPIFPFLFTFYSGSDHNFSITTLYYSATNFFDIAFHFIILLQGFIISYCKYLQSAKCCLCSPTNQAIQHDCITWLHDVQVVSIALLNTSYCTLRHWFWGIAPPPTAECMCEMEICVPAANARKFFTYCYRAVQQYPVFFCGQLTVNTPSFFCFNLTE